MQKNNVNPYAGCLPLLVQMPILMALWQSISRVPALQEGKFFVVTIRGPRSLLYFTYISCTIYILQYLFV